MNLLENIFFLSFSIITFSIRTLYAVAFKQLLRISFFYILKLNGSKTQDKNLSKLQAVAQRTKVLLKHEKCVCLGNNSSKCSVKILVTTQRF